MPDAHVNPGAASLIGLEAEGPWFDADRQASGVVFADDLDVGARPSPVGDLRGERGRPLGPTYEGCHRRLEPPEHTDHDGAFDDLTRRCQTRWIPGHAPDSERYCTGRRPR